MSLELNRDFAHILKSQAENIEIRQVNGENSEPEQLLPAFMFMSALKIFEMLLMDLEGEDFD